MNEQGIMALGQGMQAPTAQPQGGLPPEVMMAFEQARGTLTPEQVSGEALAAMQEADPGMVAQLSQMLRGMELPIEVLDALGQLVDEVLTNPQDYQALRADLMSDPEVADALSDILPPEFDAAFFAGLNVALDQLAANMMPMGGMQAFADGGIASLKPVAAGLAKMGRGQDTMLAHITPSEARMLRVRGGSGTINPATGLPEFFVKKVAKAVKGAVKGVTKAVKGVVKGIGSAIKSVASSTVGRIVLSAAAFMIGGPALAAAFPSIAAFSPAIAVGLANTGMALASGAKFGDALKQGVIAGATTYGAQQLTSFIAGTPSAVGAPIDTAAVYDPTTGLTTPGTLSGQIATPGGLGAAGGYGAPAGAEVLTPSTVSATTPPPPITSGVDYSLAGASPATTGMGGGVTAAPAVTPNANYSLLPGTDYSLVPPSQYSALPPPTAATTTAATAPTSAFGHLAQAGRDVMNQEYLSAAKNVGEGLFGTPLRAGTTMLAGTYLSGGFTPKEEGPPGLIPSETGYDLLRQNPEVYGTAPGGAQTVYAPNPMMGSVVGPYGFQRPVIQMRPVQYPTYAADGGEIRKYADGGIAGLFKSTATATPSQYQPVNVYYDNKENRYVMQDPSYVAPPARGGLGGMIARVIAAMRNKAGGTQQQYVPFDPGMFTSGMSPQQYLESQKQAQQAAAAKPFFTPGGAQVVPIQQNLAGTAATALPMFATGGMPEKFPRRNGQISGPGTEKSDDIPAMLSDGEFVMTARAVRGAGNGSRREGAKRMYQMMHQLERMA